MITKHDDLLGTLVHDVAHLLRLEIDRRVKEHSLTRTKWLALGVISANAGLSQADLAAKLELGPAAVGRLVDRLEDREFVTRTPCNDDRRAYRLHLTPESERLVNTLRSTAGELREDILAGLSDDDLGTLSSGLKRLKKNLQQTSAGFSLPVISWPFDLQKSGELVSCLSCVPIF